jgi:Uma2 family endonuclease
MAAPATPRLYTWDEIKDWPESNVRTELVDGELVVSPSPTPRHQDTVLRLTLCLSEHLKEKNLGKLFLGPLDVVLDEAVVYQPDLFFITEARIAVSQSEKFEGPPDLAIEVISEHNRSHDTSVKFRHYEQYGVREYWMVDHRDQHIRVYSLADGKYELVGAFEAGSQLKSMVLPEFKLDPADVL